MTSARFSYGHGGSREGLLAGLRSLSNMFVSPHALSVEVKPEVRMQALSEEDEKVSSLQNRCKCCQGRVSKVSLPAREFACFLAYPLPIVNISVNNVSGPCKWCLLHRQLRFSKLIPNTTHLELLSNKIYRTRILMTIRARVRDGGGCSRHCSRCPSKYLVLTATL